jgi:hypothetical protein
MLEPISGASMAGIYLSKMPTWIPLSGTLAEWGRATQQVRTASGPVTMKLASAEISKVRVLDVSVTGTGVNYSKLAVYTK